MKALLKALTAYSTESAFNADSVSATILSHTKTRHTIAENLELLAVLNSDTLLGNTLAEAMIDKLTNDLAKLQKLACFYHIDGFMCFNRLDFDNLLGSNLMEAAHCIRYSKNRMFE